MGSVRSRMTGAAVLVALVLACIGGLSGRPLVSGVTVLEVASSGVTVRSAVTAAPAAGEMAPGDSVTQTVTITAGTAGPVAVFAALPAGVSCAGTIEGQIRLSVTDVASGRALFQGGLCDIPVSVPACGASALSGCSAWTAGESHDYTLVTRLPLSTGNSFQGAHGEVALLFAAEAGDIGAIQGMITVPDSGADLEGPILVGSALIVLGTLLSRRRPRGTGPAA